MRFAYLGLVACIACKKADPPPPTITPPSETRDAAVAVADAATSDAPGGAQLVDVELVQLTAATVRVSSRVANPNIKPTHLVDKNMATAWNSVTGQLVGAWIEIHPIDGAEIHEVKLTAGFTAKGPKGEDWFTMNTRIRRMRVLADGLPQPDIYLDVDNRTLQTFPISATDSIRLEVNEVVDGTKKRWREITVSELEVWGTTPVGWVSPKPLPSIDVAVGKPGVLTGDPCAGVDEDVARINAENEKLECHGMGCDDHRYPPRCGVEETTTIGGPLVAPWNDPVAWCYVHDEIYGPNTCSVRFARGGDTATAEREVAFASARMDISLEMQEVLSASTGPEVIVRISHTNSDGDVDEEVSVCRADTFMCSLGREVPKGAKLSAQPWEFKK